MGGPRLDAIRLTLKDIVSEQESKGVFNIGSDIVSDITHITPDVAHDIMPDFHCVVLHAGLCMFGRAIPIQN